MVDLARKRIALSCFASAEQEIYELVALGVGKALASLVGVVKRLARSKAKQRDREAARG